LRPPPARAKNFLPPIHTDGASLSGVDFTGESRWRYRADFFPARRAPRLGVTPHRDVTREFKLASVPIRVDFWLTPETLRAMMHAAVADAPCAFGNMQFT
jgi:hypothetical protein